jgi:hypothetical protein
MFSQFYSEETKDPCGGRYDRIMARFDASRVDALPSATLMSQVVGLSLVHRKDPASIALIFQADLLEH